MLEYSDHQLADALRGSDNYRVLRRVRPIVQVKPDAFPDASIVGIALDTETTGLDHNKDVVIEIALTRFRFLPDSGMILGAESRLDMPIDPGRPIPPSITEITGIRDDDVRGLAVDPAALAAIVNGASVVIAHGAGFDRTFAEKLCPVFAALPWACSYSQVDWRAEGIESGKLGWLLSVFGFFYDAHRAAADVDALVTLLCQPLPRSGKTVLKTLLEAAAAPSWNAWAIGAPYDRKDELKLRGYKWSDGSNGQFKSWHMDGLDIATAQEEKVWLSAFCRPWFDKVDALRRFSGRTA